MSALYCSASCGGRDCKWENYRNFESATHHTAFPGLYSDWVTHQILATCRPSTRLLAQYQLLSAFRLHGIQAIFNLQEPHEHAHCGDGIHADSGFSYRPQEFMASGIFFYNFGWADMDVPELGVMRSLVQVMAHALEAGRKVAVHCHAGLGRTGLAIACYLVYGTHATAEAAIDVVRRKRPGSIQTRKQTGFVHDFAAHLERLRRCIVLAVGWSRVTPSPRAVVGGGGSGSASPALSTTNSSSNGGGGSSHPRPLSLGEQLQNQQLHLHGLDARRFRRVPKVVHELVTRLKHILRHAYRECGGSVEQFSELHYHPLCQAMLEFEGGALLQGNAAQAGKEDESPRTQRLLDAANQGRWEVVREETSTSLLLHLLLLWITALREPLISDTTLHGLQHVREVEELQYRDLFCTIDCILDLFRVPPYLALHPSAGAPLLRKLAVLMTTQRMSLQHALAEKPAALSERVRRPPFFQRVSRSLSQMSLGAWSTTLEGGGSSTPGSPVPSHESLRPEAKEGHAREASSISQAAPATAVDGLQQAVDLLQHIYTGREWVVEERARRKRSLPNLPPTAAGLTVAVMLGNGAMQEELELDGVTGELFRTCAPLKQAYQAGRLGPLGQSEELEGSASQSHSTPAGLGVGVASTSVVDAELPESEAMRPPSAKRSVAAPPVAPVLTAEERAEVDRILSGEDPLLPPPPGWTKSGEGVRTLEDSDWELELERLQRRKSRKLLEDELL